MQDQSHEIQMIKSELDEALKTIELYEQVAAGRVNPKSLDPSDPVMILARVYVDNARLTEMVHQLENTNLRLARQVSELQIAGGNSDKKKALLGKFDQDERFIRKDTYSSGINGMYYRNSATTDASLIGTAGDDQRIRLRPWEFVGPTELNLPNWIPGHAEDEEDDGGDED